MPKVSILVPNYNYARFLDQRLGSIERQTCTDFEVILLDDASTDDSVQILKRFAREHRCQLVCNEHNSGSAFKQWNKGLKVATGQYVWIAEADDYADERFLEILVGRLEQNPECGLAYCNSSAVDASGHIIDLVRPTMYDVDLTWWRRDFVGSGREECIRYLIRENTIQNASAVVFKRELCDVVGGADETLKLASDWKFWASLLCVSNLAFVAAPLNYFRTHGSSVRAKTRSWMHIIEALQVMNYIADTLDVPRDALEDLHARLAVVLLHGWITQRPSATDLVRVRELVGSLQFGFSLRAASGFTRQVLQALTQRLHGARVK
jgi:glycosyltransferase involved in cell wall biosynthesis